MTTNTEKFPENIFEPELVELEEKQYMLYRARFANLYDLYDYLKSDPNINKDVFKRLLSVKGDSDFAGKPYKEAVEDLIGEIDPGYKEFLELQGVLNAKKGSVNKYKTVRTLAGGHINIPAYSAGSPLCYETEERIMKPKFARIHVTLSYNCKTSKSQVLHRAIIITNVLKALEKAGYNVDLNTFELSHVWSEIVYIVVQIKRHGGILDMQALYKTLCQVEFLRRILFRILETLDVRESWNFGYGQVCEKEFALEVLKFGKNDIYFDQPENMGIGGRNLVKDFECAMDILNLDDKIDVERAKSEFKKHDTKILVKD